MTGSLSKLPMIGPGSAMPVVSIMRRLNSGMAESARLKNRSRSVSAISVVSVQHKQPDSNKIVLSAMCWLSTVRSKFLARMSSKPVAPSSLMMTAVSFMPEWLSNLFKSVVFPEPRKPVNNVIGIRLSIDEYSHFANKVTSYPCYLKRGTESTVKCAQLNFERTVTPK